ncbi:hypothetical protein [Halomontanus rarus]|uniref:hypothetical protein n=1 Tax=Halomontanus rarus TaxID=3034020 RepID=UPI001A97F04B
MIRHTRVILLLAVLTLAAGSVWGLGVAADVSSVSQPAPEPGLEGAGVADDPYVVTNVEELRAVGEEPAAHYELGADVDATEETFEPIGDADKPFTGRFDGNGHAISGLSIDAPRERHVGLFGVVDGGTVENVALEGVSVVGGEQVGALVGHNAGTIRESTAGGSVEGTSDVGGLVGVTDGALTRSSARVDVNATSVVGGLVGISACGPVTDSRASGEVSGVDTVGGLIGENRCTVLRSYAVGPVDAETDGGGAIGEHLGGSVESVYWDVDATGRDDSAAGVARSTDELQGSSAETTLEGFDFESTWETADGYPALAWEDGSAEPSDGIELDGYTARDLTGDGRHEDVTGSGDVTTQDVVVFFEHVEHEAVRNNVEAFDFDGNGQLSVSDVLALFELVGTIDGDGDQR